MPLLMRRLASSSSSSATPLLHLHHSVPKKRKRKTISASFRRQRLFHIVISALFFGVFSNLRTLFSLRRPIVTVTDVPLPRTNTQVGVGAGIDRNRNVVEHSPFDDECDLSEVGAFTSVHPQGEQGGLYPSSSSSSSNTSIPDFRHVLNLCTSSSSQLSSRPCWLIYVRPRQFPHLKLRLIFPPSFQTSPKLSPYEHTLFSRVHGCTTPASCAVSTRCAFGLEDPSDAFWLRRYATQSKFVVFFDVGLVSLLFFLLAIVVDGSIFFPHRQGLSVASASALILLAVASLLYTLFIPPKLQFALYGKGSWNTIAFVFLVMVIASLLPAMAVVWLSCMLFMIFFIGFLAEYLFVVFVSTLHFVVLFIFYQVQSMALHVRLLYFPSGDIDDEGLASSVEDDEEDDDDGGNRHRRSNDTRFDTEVVCIARQFLERIRGNWFISRIPQLLEERALQMTHNSVPNRVHDQLLLSSSTDGGALAPIVDFDSLDDIHDREDRRHNDSGEEEEGHEVVSLPNLQSLRGNYGLQRSEYDDVDASEHNNHVTRQARSSPDLTQSSDNQQQQENQTQHNCNSNFNSNSSPSPLIPQGSSIPCPVPNDSPPRAHATSSTTPTSAATEPSSVHHTNEVTPLLVGNTESAVGS